jgi:hypothetical protein
MRRVLLGCSLVVAAAAVGFGGNVARNRAAARRVDAACAVLLAERPPGPAEPLLARLLGTDATATLHADVRAEDTALCGFVQDELAWSRWNVGRRVAAPTDPARDARIEAALASATDQCPPVMSSLLLGARAALGGTLDAGALASDAAAACAGLTRGLAPVPKEPVAVWDWPARLEARAATASARVSAAGRSAAGSTGAR